MGMKSGLKKTFFGGYDVKKWIGLESVVDNAKTIKGFYDDLQDKSKGTKREAKPETFEQAAKRFGLNEAAIGHRMKQLFYTSLGFAVIALALFCYAFFLIFSKAMIMSGVVTVVLALVATSYAFRENFNYYQLKRRKLGCSYRDWMRDTFTGK